MLHRSKMMYFVNLLVLMLACFAKAVPPPLPSQICTDRLDELTQEFASRETIPDINSYIQTNTQTDEYHINETLVDDYCSLFRKVVPIYENNIADLRILCNTDYMRNYLDLMPHIINVATSMCDVEKTKDVKALLTCANNNRMTQHGFGGCLQGILRGLSSLSLSKPDSLTCSFEIKRLGRETKMEESAEHEPDWKKAGLKPGIQIWRIVKFKVTHWQQEDYGKFYDGDSYIILNTYKEEGNEQLVFDAHFWIGKHSTQDEYGTAAYKTVELDTYLDDAPIQHREVQGHESELFRSYFKNITYLHGGADSGFRHVKPEVIKTETETLEEETTSESDEFYRGLDQEDEDDFDSSSDFVSSKTEKELYREYDENFQSWFTAVATSFKSCLCQFDSCAPESTRSITEMLTSHQLDTCTIVSYALWGI